MRRPAFFCACAFLPAAATYLRRSGRVKTHCDTFPDRTGSAEFSFFSFERRFASVFPFSGRVEAQFSNRKTHE